MVALLVVVARAAGEVVARVAVVQEVGGMEVEALVVVE